MTRQEFLPLPAQAAPEAGNAGGYHLQRAGENGYVVISGLIQSTFVVTADSVVLVGAPPATGDKLSAANAWAAQKIWIATVAEQVSAGPVTRWQDRIAAVDTFTSDTVAAAVESISTDSPIRIL